MNWQKGLQITSREDSEKGRIWLSPRSAYRWPQIYVRSAKSAKGARDKLEKHFEQKSLSRKIFYRRKLHAARMDTGTSMLAHVNYIHTLSDHLEAVDDAVAEKDLDIILISSLNVFTAKRRGILQKIVTRREQMQKGAKPGICKQT